MAKGVSASKGVSGNVVSGTKTSAPSKPTSAAKISSNVPRSTPAKRATLIATNLRSVRATRTAQSNARVSTHTRTRLAQANSRLAAKKEGHQAKLPVAKRSKLLNAIKEVKQQPHRIQKLRSTKLNRRIGLREQQKSVVAKGIQQASLKHDTRQLIRRSVRGGERSPRTPVGHRGKVLEHPNYLKKPINMPTWLKGRKYTGHALDQMQGRGIFPSVVANTIKVGMKGPGNTPTEITHYDPVNKVKVVTNKRGDVITVIG